jgi:hypothetical protein
LTTGPPDLGDQGESPLAQERLLRVRDLGDTVVGDQHFELGVVAALADQPLLDPGDVREGDGPSALTLDPVHQKLEDELEQVRVPGGNPRGVLQV